MNHINIYANFLKNFLKPEKPLKIIFDCSNGATGVVLKKLFHNHQSLIIKQINGNPDGNFPAHGPNPLKSGATKEIQKTVKEEKADLGIIFDADGDRAFFIDNLGRLIDPDIITHLLIWSLKPKKTIIDTCAGWMIKKTKFANTLLIPSKVGHFYIKNIMQKNKADLAAERSGHYYFKRFFYSDSGILTAIEIINAVSALPYKLSDFIDLLPQYYRSKEFNIPIKNKLAADWNFENYQKSLKKIEQILKKTMNGERSKTSHLDGLTMEFSNWWFNLRPSNTEPLIRLNIEAASKKLLNQKLKELLLLIKNVN